MNLRIALLTALLVQPSLTNAVQVLSDGSDGALHPLGSVIIDLPSGGILNYTTIDIPAGVSVMFRRNAANTPVFLAASDGVNISGTIDVSAVATDLGTPVPVPNNPKMAAVRARETAEWAVGRVPAPRAVEPRAARGVTEASPTP